LIVITCVATLTLMKYSAKAMLLRNFHPPEPSIQQSDIFNQVTLQDISELANATHDVSRRPSGGCHSGIPPEPPMSPQILRCSFYRGRGPAVCGAHLGEPVCTCNPFSCTRHQISRVPEALEHLRHSDVNREVVKHMTASGGDVVEWSGAKILLIAYIRSFTLF